MQYVNHFNIQQAVSINFKDTHFLVYEDSHGHLVIGELDPLQ